jgi:hypothetical protein
MRVQHSVKGEFMRLFCSLSVVSILAFVALGASQTGGSVREQFVLVEFADQHVTVFVLTATSLSEFQTKGSNIEVVADCAKRTLRVSGVGEVVYKTHRLAFSGEGIAIDGKQLSPTGKNFVLSPNGEIREGFVRTFDHEPHQK